MINIESISAENLRNYAHTQLSFRKLTVLVGENNEGKSSLLKMFERFMQIKPEFWQTDRTLGDEDFEFWYPANDARHQARRFTVNIKFSDGRTAKRFGATKANAIPLRLAIDSSGGCRLNIGAPKRGEIHDSKAVELFVLLNEHIELVFLPPIRDAKSSTFTQKVTQKAKSGLRERLIHNKQAGAPAEYRLAKDVISKIEQIVELHNSELSRAENSPLASMLRSSEVRVELFPKDIYSLIEKSMSVYLSTGDHDALKVSPDEVGNGLQSLIDINLSVEEILSRDKEKNIVVVVEEPEAFLHPSAQRQFMQFLRRALIKKVHSAILTTHSPIILDEAKYEEIVLVRNQKHFEPTPALSDRASINTSLMTTASSEVFFARTVVLLEGEGDRAFFNTLLRRIKEKAAVSPELAGLVFQITGGCTFYAPWLKLAKSYRRKGEDPFTCIWIMDGDAATKNGDRPVLRATQDCGINLHPTEKNSIISFGDLDWTSKHRMFGCNDSANKALANEGGYLFCCDFEWALFNKITPPILKNIKKAFADANISTIGSEIELAQRIGSKIEKGSSIKGAKKQPFIRSLIAENLELSELPPEIYSVLHRILSACYKADKNKISGVLKACGIGSA